MPSRSVIVFFSAILALGGCEGGKEADSQAEKKVEDPEKVKLRETAESADQELTNVREEAVKAVKDLQDEADKAGKSIQKAAEEAQSSLEENRTLLTNVSKPDYTVEDLNREMKSLSKEELLAVADLLYAEIARAETDAGSATETGTPPRPSRSPGPARPRRVSAPCG